MKIFNLSYIKAKIAEQLFKINSYSENNLKSIFDLSSFRSENLYTNSNNINEVSISIVTFNSKKWLVNFFKSLDNSGLDFSNAELLICDNGSTDGTIEEFKKILVDKSFKKVNIIKGTNIGFGAGHNKNIELATSPYILVTNVDIEFEPNSIETILKRANESSLKIASWEFRQIPYEHPKYYDPVSQLTNWNSHACVLLRTSAIKEVGGYDDNIFMYGEDVDLSYSLRSAGYLLSYFPDATIIHNTYESAGQVKPVQYSGSTFANWYLRLKYGSFLDILAIPKLYLTLLRNPEPYKNAHQDIRANFNKLKKLFIKTILNKNNKVKIKFGFYEYDYEFIRDGAFYKIIKPLSNGPLVSVITRTYKGREEFLRQALISVKNQTYKNIEHIVVEDGGNTYVDFFKNNDDFNNIKYITLSKVGRCVTGNAALKVAKGEYFLFLDDDDLLFADHIELLLAELIQHKDYVAAYSPSIQVDTQYTTKPYTETALSKPIALQQEFNIEKLNQCNYITIQSILFQKNLFETRGGFDENIDVLEDWNLWLRYAHLNQFKYINKTTSMYRVPAEEGKYEQRKQILDRAYDEVFKLNQDYLSKIKSATKIYF